MVRKFLDHTRRLRSGCWPVLWSLGEARAPPHQRQRVFADADGMQRGPAWRIRCSTPLCRWPYWINSSPYVVVVWGRVLYLYSALCTEGSVRSELSNTFPVFQPYYPVFAAASTDTGSPGWALNHVGGTRSATKMDVLKPPRLKPDLLSAPSRPYPPGGVSAWNGPLNKTSGWGSSSTSKICC